FFGAGKTGRPKGLRGCCSATTKRTGTSGFLPICFALVRRLWCNSNNFPKGGWPGARWEHKKCQHGEPFAPAPYVLTLEKLAMKKSLVALAALAAAGVASAQSSVTLFGIVDASISSVSNKSELVTDPFTLLTNPYAYLYLP